MKVTSPGSDLSRESLAFRVEQLEQRLSGGPPPPAPAAPAAPTAAAEPTPVAPQPGPISTVGADCPVGNQCAAIGVPSNDVTV